MELEQLRQLEATERCGTMSAAAAELHISQPALSRSIQRLETELGCELFDRSKNHVTLNDVGRIAVEHARAVLEQVQLLVDAVNDAADRNRPLRVGTCAPAPLWHLTSLVLEAVPGEVLSSEMTDEKDIERGIINGVLDLGITRRPLMLPNVASVQLMTENLSVSVPEGHELAGRSYVSLADLDGRDFLLYQDIGVWNKIHDEAMPNANFVVQQDRQVFMQLTQNTRMLFFVTDAAGSWNETPGRVVIPISDPAAHATFYVLGRTDLDEQVRTILHAVRSRSSGN